MIEIRPIQPSDGQALNDKLIANWPSATHGPAAWLVWHKDAVAVSPQNVGFVAIDTETNKLIGSVLTRYRTKEYSPAMESDANGEIQSWWRAELSGLDSSDIGIR
ncbi:hypothetical protein HDU99_000523 [Rhizoclosmatium hyalinum]|nr:hypothetical protein HDU99_000523 [Rhizoclosmatium hyalinum]